MLSSTLLFSQEIEILIDIDSTSADTNQKSVEIIDPIVSSAEFPGGTDSLNT